MSKVNWSEKDEFYWLRDANGEVLTFESILDAEAAARQVEIDIAVKAEVKSIVAWLWLHGMCQIANSVEKGHYK